MGSLQPDDKTGLQKVNYADRYRNEALDQSGAFQIGFLPKRTY